MNLPFELQESETVLKFCRRHWMYLYPRLALQALAGILPIAILTILVAFGPGLGGILGVIVLVADLAWAVFWLIRVYFTWYRYNNDIWVVTNQRLIDSLRRNWFHHQMASADLIDVEDIAVHREGIVPTIFNFGDLRCQTAGTQPNFILSGIPDPAGILAVVDAARDRARQASLRPAWER